jgi:hypothetical protein
MVPSAANAATCLPSTFNSGAAKLRHGKATQMSRSFRLCGCWHWLSGRRPHLPGAWYAGYRSRPSIRPIGFSRRPGRSSMCDRSRGLADLSSGGNDSSANAALAGPDDLELSLVANFFYAASHSVRPRNYPDPFGRHRRLHLGAMA